MIALDSSDSLPEKLESAMQEAYEEADAAAEADNVEAKWAWERAAETFGSLAVQARNDGPKTLDLGGASSVTMNY